MLNRIYNGVIPNSFTLIVNNISFFKIAKSGAKFEFKVAVPLPVAYAQNSPGCEPLSQCDDDLFGSKMHVLYNRMTSSLY